MDTLIPLLAAVITLIALDHDGRGHPPRTVRRTTHPPRITRSEDGNALLLTANLGYER
jgi:hypothetical protein